MAKEKWEIKK